MSSVQDGALDEAMINETLHERLKYCSTLPSLPAVALRVLELSRDPSSSMRDVANVVISDPALATKILRIANSPLYARRRECETFQQALVLLGLNATLTLALTFSLVSSMKASSGSGLDLDRVWRRSLLAGAAARVLSAHFGASNPEEAFLAALLQDIGMLALDRGYSEIYESLSAGQQDHDVVRAIEFAELQCDHCAVGAWLLKRWNLPEHLQHAVANSHRQVEKDVFPTSVDEILQRSVALSGPMADLWMSLEPGLGLEGLQKAFVPVEGVDGATLSLLIEQVAMAAPAIEELFEIDLLDPVRSEWILQEAREIIVLRNMQMVQESARLREVAASLQRQAHVLEEKSRRDKLTGAFNRGHLDEVLSDWFADANRAGIPISLVFIDLDHFKSINDLHGHQRGDQVLVSSTKIISRLARASDLVARYGGEEFVMLLPDCTASGAELFCERLLNAFRKVEHQLDSGDTLTVTISIGVATHGEQVEFDSCHQLLRCADQAMYRAKQSGRDRCVQHHDKANAA
ncbi:MAG: diguanylate cyclase (GGDEF)-like protein [Gammaproteobacteria bacterium]|jgi:diguanylate cyclase (GGDEF)-like protein